MYNRKQDEQANWKQKYNTKILYKNTIQKVQWWRKNM